MSDNEKYFHFTLGPVQGFVAQARRTRDFWAGSFLLSWLAGVAMQAVKVQGGEIKFPIPDKDFLEAIETGKANILPQQGVFQTALWRIFQSVQILMVRQWYWRSRRLGWLWRIRCGKKMRKA